MRLATLALLALALACSPTPATQQPQVPDHLASMVASWADVVLPIVETIWKERRWRPGGQLKWTDAEWTRVEATREAAREAIAAASAEDRPWLLVEYLGLFGGIGLGSEWADALLEVPPEHPAWSIPWVWGEVLFDALAQSSDPLRFRHYILAVAAEHDAPHIQSVAIYVELEDADRAGDWDRAQALYARLQTPEFQRGARAFEASLYYNPDRVLRVDRHVPHFCMPAIAGPHEAESVCLDGLFPHGEPTLIVGWASWCGPCNEQLPQVVDLVRDRPLRVLTINYHDEPERAREHLRGLGVEDWTILHLATEDLKRRNGSGPLDGYPIPYLALVDGSGMVVAGPPRLDAESLAEWLTAD
jgi:thiol-disulfide isomerase/thioredoxin